MKTKKDYGDSMVEKTIGLVFRNLSCQIDKGNEKKIFVTVDSIKHKNEYDFDSNAIISNILKRKAQEALLGCFKSNKFNSNMYDGCVSYIEEEGNNYTRNKKVIKA